MAEAGTEQFKRVIESQHSGIATFAKSVCLLPKKQAASDWDGVVQRARPICPSVCALDAR